MKLSISIPDVMGNEIKEFCEKTERSISWAFQKAWMNSRHVLLRDTQAEAKQTKKAMKKLSQLKGVIASDYPQETSVSLASKAFHSSRSKRK